MNINSSYKLYKNKYFKTMSTDALVQQMIQEGINYSHFCDVAIHYSSCPYCNDTISQEIYPSLLQCGHITCSQCTPTCGICNTKKPVKIEVFRSLLNYLDMKYKLEISLSQQAEIFYKFSINHINSREGMCFDEISENVTIGQLLRQMPKFRQFYSRVRKSTSISLGSKNLLYSQVQGKTFKELRKAGVPLNTKLTNYLFYLDRSLGGSLK